MEHTEVLRAIAKEIGSNGTPIKCEDLRNALNSCGLENVWGDSYKGSMEKVVKAAYDDLQKEAELIRRNFVNNDGKPYF